MYEKYKGDGFKILGISLDTDTKRWLAAIERTGSVWPELCAASKECEAEIRESYNIVGIPYGVLIDQSGKVIRLIAVTGKYLSGYWKNTIRNRC